MKRWRVFLAISIIMLCGAAITSRLVYIQLIQNKYYEAMAKGQENVATSFKGDRGKIYFKNGEPLAINMEELDLFATPSAVKNKGECAKALAEITGIDENEIKKKLDMEGSQEIKKALSPQETEKLNNKKLDGVYVEKSMVRYYPKETMASRLVGFVGGEGKGQYGVEGYYNDLLEGKEIYDQSSLDSLEYENSADGADIYLTIDYNIQFFAEKALEEAKKNMDIEGGQIIIMEPSTGKILALANYPNFNPNNYKEEKKFEVFQNPALQSLYEPGSIFKPLTMAGALDKERITPETKYVDTGRVNVGTWVIHNFAEKAYGEKTMTQVLENSINTGAVYAERQLGNENFLSYLEKFGFFSPSGVELNEIYSENKELKKGYEISYYTAAFGQGIEVTPMQMVKAYSAIANNGYMATPKLIEKVSKGGNIEETKIDSGSPVISSKAASELTGMMVSVIEKGIKRAKVPGYYVAGKTGTAQVSYSALNINKRGYSDKTWQSFMGIVPAYSPRIIVMVKLDNPQSRTAEFSAGPVFKEVAKYTLNYLEVPFDYENKENTSQ